MSPALRATPNYDRIRMVVDAAWRGFVDHGAEKSQRRESHEENSRCGGIAGVRRLTLGGGHIRLAVNRKEQERWYQGGAAQEPLEGPGEGRDGRRHPCGRGPLPRQGDVEGDVPHGKARLDHRRLFPRLRIARPAQAPHALPGEERQLRARQLPWRAAPGVRQDDERAQGLQHGAGRAYLRRGTGELIPCRQGQARGLRHRHVARRAGEEHRRQAGQPQPLHDILGDGLPRRGRHHDQELRVRQRRQHRPQPRVVQGQG